MDQAKRRATFGGDRDPAIEALVNYSYFNEKVNPVDESVNRKQEETLFRNASKDFKQLMPSSGRYSLPTYRPRKSRLSKLIQNSLANRVLAAVQNCSTVSDLPWSRINRIYLPQLVWAHELFSDCEDDGENERS